MARSVIKGSGAKEEHIGQRMSVAEYRKIRKVKQNKYRNKKVEIDGHVFDSIAESKYLPTTKVAGS
ncbi:DUF1064 domain-containing protein [Siminovitchia terrae]|nr:DUF1064 domain-containing protein [Siminovitchia terrae]